MLSGSVATPPLPAVGTAVPTQAAKGTVQAHIGQVLRLCAYRSRLHAQLRKRVGLERTPEARFGTQRYLCCRPQDESYCFVRTSRFCRWNVLKYFSLCFDTLALSPCASVPLNASPARMNLLVHSRLWRKWWGVAVQMASTDSRAATRRAASSQTWGKIVTGQNNRLVWT
jgi:hypothetical protein